MKKSVIILIGLIYITSIILVGFFGTKIGTYDVVVYAEKIEVLNKDVKTLSGQKILTFDFIPYENEQDNINYIQLDWKVTPENATNIGVIFSYASNITHASVSPLGIVYFKSKGSITVYISADDGSNIETSIIIRAK